MCFQMAGKLHRMVAMMQSTKDAAPLPSDKKAADTTVTTTMHHNKPSSPSSSSILIQATDIADNRWRLLNEKWSVAADDVTPACKYKKVRPLVLRNYLREKQPIIPPSTAHRLFLYPEANEPEVHVNPPALCRPNLTHRGRVTQICVFNTRLFSLHSTLNYAIHRACLRIVLLTDVYRNLTSLWINL